MSANKEQVRNYMDKLNVMMNGGSNFYTALMIIDCLNVDYKDIDDKTIDDVYDEIRRRDTIYDDNLRYEIKNINEKDLEEEKEY